MQERLDIEGYSEYYLLGEDVFKKKNDKRLIFKKHVKMKNDLGIWKGVSLSKIKSLSGLNLILPYDTRPIKNSIDTYIDTKGNVYTFSTLNPQGIQLVNYISKSNGYPRVNIIYNNKRRSIEVHILMAETFIMEDYISKGFVCMHLDSNKLNNNLSNLDVGTYSENNKDAYIKGINKSKKGSKEHRVLSSKRIDWESIDMENLLKTHNNNYTIISKLIGCSPNSIKKRRIKLGL